MPSKTFVTPDQYLDIERRAETKSEYLDGAMYAMPGGSYLHAVIIGNFTTALNIALRGRNCTVTPNNVRLKISAKGLYAYPDIMVVCGKPAFSDDHLDMIENPQVIVEVVSPATEGYDRGAKFAQFRRLKSLQEYVLVTQNEARAECFRRLQNNDWVLRESIGLNSAVVLESVSKEIRLGDVYTNVEFSSANAAAPIMPEGSAS